MIDTSHARGARLARAAGAVLLAAVGLVTLLAPALSPQSPEEQFRDRAYAPPMRIYLRDAEGLRRPFVYQQVLEDRLARRYGEDRSQPIPIRFFADGRLVSVAPEHGPLLLLGADALGRDVLSRLVEGARLSLGVVALGVAGALVVGALLGGLAGAVGGRTDSIVMAASDFVLVLPGVYLVLVLRGVLPAVLTAGQVFWLMGGLFALAGWPHVARGVRAIVATERTRDYAEAARAAGAGPVRLARHLLPAARGFVAVEAVLLVPALLVAEVTISFLGLGFPEPTASWGTLLQDAYSVRVLAEAPWLLAPAAALFLIVLGVQLVSGPRATTSVLDLGQSRTW